MTKRKPRGDHLWNGIRGYHGRDWQVHGLIAPGDRKPVARVIASSSEEALTIARRNYPEGLYPLSVKRADGVGVTTWEM